jgi:TonB family protein
MTGGIILSWLFPLLEIRKPAAISSFTNVYFIDPYAVTSTSASALPESVGGTSISIFTIVLILYFIGLLILAFRHFFMFRKLHRIDRQKDNSDNTIVYTNTNEIFTLFSKIFIPKDLKSSNDLDTILLHEKAHLQQLHMIDLIIAETNLLLTWFNPFSWLISRMIKENHEHLADRTVLSKGVNPAHYKAQLLSHTVGVDLFRLGNQFNHSLTKKRFQMMKKFKSPKKGFIKYLALVPAIIIALGLFTAASAQQKAIHGKVVFEDGSAAPGTSIVVVGGTYGVVADLKGEFTLELEGNPELDLSFVGYKTVRISAKDLKKRAVVLHPQAFEMDLKDVEASKQTDEKIVFTGKNIEVDSDKITIKTKIDSDEQPVFVVDGKVVEDIESLDPDDIKNVSVIKDPYAAEVKKYNAKNGLVIITMKEKSKYSAEILSPQGEIFYVVEDIPSYPGGKEVLKAYIYKNLVYPEKAKKKGLNGEVYVQFTVNHKGELKDIKAIRSSDKILNEAALDVFRDMPLWNPGKQRGKPVRATVIVPVRFNADQD